MGGMGVIQLRASPKHLQRLQKDSVYSSRMKTVAYLINFDQRNPLDHLKQKQIEH